MSSCNSPTSVRTPHLSATPRRRARTPPRSATPGRRAQTPPRSATPRRRAHTPPPRSATPRRRAHTPPRPATPRRPAQTPPRPATPRRHAQTPPRSATPRRPAQTPLRSATPRRRAHTPPRSATPRRCSQTPPRSATPRRPAHTPPQSETPRRRAQTPPRSATPRRSAQTPPRSATPGRRAHTPPRSATPRRPARTPPWPATPRRPAQTPHRSATPGRRAKFPSQSATLGRNAGTPFRQRGLQQTNCTQPPNQGSATTSTASGPVIISKYNNCHKHKLELKDYTKRFKCDGCKQKDQGERYRCDNCNKEFHKECRSFFKTWNGSKHEYQLTSYNKIFECDGCKEEGFGKRFRCDLSGNELHKQCMFPEYSIHIKWLTRHAFKFLKTSKSEKVCDACTKDIKGYFYHCADYVHPCGTRKRLDLHPCCINLSPILYAGLDEPVDKDEQKYTLTIKAPSKSKCYLCRKKKLKDTCVPGWSYVCARGDSCYHVRCVQEAVHEACVNRNNIDIKTAIDHVSALNHLVRNRSKRSDGIVKNMGLMIFKVILKMIVSTLLGDPTLGLVHVFGELFTN